MSDAVRAPGRPAPGAPTWQLRAWPNDPTSKLIVFADHLGIPSPAELDRALDAARRAGALTVRTSALFPRAAEAAMDHGFVPIDTLCLLRVRLDDTFDQLVEGLYGTTLPATRTMRAWHHDKASAVDQEAFGPLWGNDAASLADIRRATPHHRARMIRDGGSIVAFAISGYGGQAGYVQRVAVATTHRRRGLARALVVDALMWMRHRPLTTAYVNTGFENTAALALYEGLGFERMDDHLTIVERAVEA
jgi:ribosomal protein S18 acetylase RimI-like enzyme